MIIKGIALTALVASTPLAMFATQEPAAGVATPARQGERSELLRAKADLVRARAELQAARGDLNKLRSQLDAALDRLDVHVAPEHDRDCSPSRNRMLMSHYQWLRQQGHRQRADGTAEKIVARVGDDPGRLNSAAWDLMTDKETAGKFDELALAMTRRMPLADDNARRRMHPNYLDTAALAHFLNGEVEQAIQLQQQAIARGGNGDDYRRRLRTYEAARVALQRAARELTPAAETMVASNGEDDE